MQLGMCICKLPFIVNMLKISRAELDREHHTAMAFSGKFSVRVKGSPKIKGVASAENGMNIRPDHADERHEKCESCEENIGRLNANQSQMSRSMNLDFSIWSYAEPSPLIYLSADALVLGACWNVTVASGIHDQECEQTL